MLSMIMLWFRTNPRNLVLIGGLLAVIAVLAFVYTKGRHDANEKNEAARAVEVQEALASDEKADTKSTAVAAAEAEQAAAIKQELIDEVAKVADGVPDESSVRLGCIELRNAGRRIADIPACRALVAGPSTSSP